MSQTAMRELLRRPYEQRAGKFSFQLKKLIGYHSVRSFSSYDAFVEANVKAQERTLNSLIAETTIGVATAGKNATQSAQLTPKKPDDTLVGLFKAGNFDAFMDCVDAVISTGAPFEKRYGLLYGRAAAEVGDPKRFIDTAERFPTETLRSPTFRLYHFICLLMLNDVDEAVASARETLLSGSFDRAYLLRLVGEHGLHRDEALTAAGLRLLSEDASASVSAKERVYLIDVAHSLLGESEALKLSHANLGRDAFVDVELLQFNMRVRHQEFVQAVKHLNAALDRHDLTPIELLDEKQPVTVNNIRSVRDVKLVEDGPLVSIAMSTFNSADTVESALASLTSQSYRNIEIVVVDDCSSDNSVELVERYSISRDERVRLIKMESNGGTYACRNRALKEARGEIFTCNDSDDWSHPSKIAALVSSLTEKEELIAVQSRLLRLNGVVGVKPKRNGYIHDDASSTAFWREPVMRSLGGYDNSKFGADNEFLSRLEIVFGQASIGKLKQPFLLADWSKTSLTGTLATGISDGGTMAPVRARYRNSYRSRHARQGDMRIHID